MIHTGSNDTTLPSHSCPRQGMFCLFSVVVALVHRGTYIYIYAVLSTTLM